MINAALFLFFKIKPMMKYAITDKPTTIIKGNIISVDGSKCIFSE